MLFRLLLVLIYDLPNWVQTRPYKRLIQFECFPFPLMTSQSSMVKVNLLPLMQEYTVRVGMKSHLQILSRLLFLLIYLPNRVQIRIKKRLFQFKYFSFPIMTMFRLKRFPVPLMTIHIALVMVNLLPLLQEYTVTGGRTSHLQMLL